MPKYRYRPAIDATAYKKTKTDRKPTAENVSTQERIWREGSEERV